MFQRLGDRWGIARSFTDLGSLASHQNDPETARSFFGQALDMFLELGHTRGVATVLEAMARAAVRDGDFERALRLAGVAEGLRDKVGVPKRPAEREQLNDDLRPAWESSGESAAEAIWAESRRMPLDDAIRFALSPVSPAPGAAPRN